jgi:hypothetical protein
MLKLSDFTVAEKNIPAQKKRDMFPLFFRLIVGSASDVLVQRTSMQELLCDLFLRRAIPESLKYGTFAGEARLYTMHAIKSARRPAPIQADGTQLFLGKVFEKSVKYFSDFYISYQREIWVGTARPGLKAIQRLL